MNELKESQIKGELLLRNPAMGTQPGTEERPNPFNGVGMHLMKAVTILATGKLLAGMVDRFMVKAP